MPSIPTLCALLLTLATPALGATAFNAANLAVVRVGTGTAAISSGIAQTLYVVEYTTAAGQASPVQTITVTGTNACTLSAVSSSTWLYDQEGVPLLATTGAFLTFPCYKTTAGSSLALSAIKVAAVVSYTGTMSTTSTVPASIASYTPTSVYQQALRQVASNGAGLWWSVASGPSGTSTGSGLYYAPAVNVANSAPVALCTYAIGSCIGYWYYNVGSIGWGFSTSALMFTDASAKPYPAGGLNSFSSAVPPVTAATAASFIGAGDASTTSSDTVDTFLPYGFVWSSATSVWMTETGALTVNNIALYVSATSLGASSSSWGHPAWERMPTTPAMLLESGTAIISLTGRSEACGVFMLYATSPSKLYSYNTATDLAATLATAPTNTVFRGVTLAPYSSAPVFAGSCSTTPTATSTTTTSITPGLALPPQFIITNVAGTGTGGYSGNGGAAVQAMINWPVGVAATATGVYFTEWGNNILRLTNTSTGIASLIAGNGSIPANCRGAGVLEGDGALATSAMVCGPRAIAVDSTGNIFFTESNRVRRIAASNKTISTSVGTGAYGFSGDNGAAKLATLRSPRGISIGPTGIIYISDCYNNRVRAVSTSNIITTVVGNGMQGFSGDGGQATRAEIAQPYGISVGSGTLYIADSFNSRIRAVQLSTGVISTIAGSSIVYGGYSGDGGLAIAAMLNTPYGVTVDGNGNVWIADTWNQVVRLVNVSTGIINTVAGGGSSSGDNMLATLAQLSEPESLTIDASGNVLITDSGNSLIRKLTLCAGACSQTATTTTTQTGTATPTSTSVSTVSPSATNTNTGTSSVTYSPTDTWHPLTRTQTPVQTPSTSLSPNYVSISPSPSLSPTVTSAACTSSATLSSSITWTTGNYSWPGVSLTIAAAMTAKGSVTLFACDIIIAASGSITSVSGAPARSGDAWAAMPTNFVGAGTQSSTVPYMGLGGTFGGCGDNLGQFSAQGNSPYPLFTCPGPTNIAYGNALSPSSNEMGSSGLGASYSSGCAVGGAGGGYIALVATQHISINGLISADGQSGQSAIGACAESGGGGSGGAIYIRTGSLLLSTGTLSAVGGASGVDSEGAANNAGGGGGGRIAIQCAPSGSHPFSPFLSNWPLLMTTIGGLSKSGRRGGAGTIYVSCGSNPSTLLMAGDALTPTPQMSTLILGSTCTQISEIIASNIGGVYIGSSSGVKLQVGSITSPDGIAVTPVLSPGVTLGGCGPTPSATPKSFSASLTASPTPYCAPTLYRALPRTDLVGTLMGNAWYPGTSLPAPSESVCRQACCDAPACDAYTFASGDLEFASRQGLAQSAACFLFTNVTALVPSNLVTSGVLLSSYS